MLELKDYQQRSIDSLEGYLRLAALRVEDTEGRKVYETCGALMDHFSGASATPAGH